MSTIIDGQHSGGLDRPTDAMRPSRDELSLEQLQLGAETYAKYRNVNDQAIRIGIFGEEIQKSLSNPDTVITEIPTEDGDKASVPVLVPMGTLEWFNNDPIREKYGDNARSYVYVHPPIYDETTREAVRKALDDKLEQGCVIVSELYDGDTENPIADLLADETRQYDVEAFGGETESRVDVFVGNVNMKNDPEVKHAPSLYEVYTKMVGDGAMNHDPTNGASLVAVIDGQDAEDIWRVYKKPFNDLEEKDPTLSGFDEETLLGILKDPDIAKIVNRVDGEITTLLIFLQNFDKAPWFNSDYYKKNFPEYFNTQNIFMFPGIVTDENKRGLNYATDVLDLAVRLFTERGSNFLITFECTEVSTTYIPKFVSDVANNSGMLNVSGLDKPISVINYYAFKKK